jgi:SprT protein
MTDLDIITTVTDSQRLQITQATHHCIERAGVLFDQNFALLTVAYVLQGKCAGMYQIKGSQRRIR